METLAQLSLETWLPVRFWLLIPLIVTVSLVYNASHYETPGLIFRRALKFSLSLSLLMAVVLGLLVLLSWGL